MIGGLMLLCAVGAMLLIAHWSLQRDDLDDAAAATGLLALRRWSQRTVDRKAGGERASRREGRRAQRATRREGRAQTVASAGARQRDRFDAREMREIAAELEDRRED